MESRVYLSNDFLDHIIAKGAGLSVEISDLEIPNNKLNYQKIRQIIAKSNLYLDFTYQQIIDIIRGNENPIKTLLLKSLIKSPHNKNYDEKVDYSKPNSVFFIGNEDCSDISANNNVFCKGTNYNFEDAFFKSPLRTVFDKKMDSEDISHTFHQTKNIILIDPYIFSNNFKKKNSLINFLDTCFNFKNNKTEKNFTIVSEFPTTKDVIKNKILINYLSELAGELNMKSENITLFRHIGTEFGSNRHLITDYALMDLQHAFDRPCVISGLYFYNDNIGKNFNEVNNLLEKIKNSEKKWSETNPDIKDQALKHNKIKIGNILNNPLFH